MSSGFGFKGREGRCYQFWKDVEQCSKETAQSGQCGKQVEDYLECLHHKKELTRMNAVALQKERQDSDVYTGGHGHDSHGH
ncbi:hypothetical protein Poli38472_001544 [Pythium oligandrum]|uniref:NADH dehydrogenase [ubiquinone] iron-sulfur protein 5 n=1 Tax=Pythium oligandrum TaxID=41045 RepID=A0A8K1FTA4_PYTOL|nr:hypothetical protein Poli38472_001544 [Pythium oligandrum]|eukprot:TMW69388.1 hypothetical protein Poli38472_001544 [Pythium oligandrum]